MTPVPSRAPYRFSNKFDKKKRETEIEIENVVVSSEKGQLGNTSEHNNVKADTNKTDAEKEKKEVIEDCETCKFCLDKPKFGGNGKLKQACEKKSKNKKRKVMATNSTPKQAKRIPPSSITPPTRATNSTPKQAKRVPPPPLITPPTRASRARRKIGQ